MSEPRAYRFADAARPGLLLGLSARQAMPVIGGILFLAAVLQAGISPLIGVAGPVVGVGVAFGRWRGSPLAETLLPGLALVVRRARRRSQWVRPPLLGDNQDSELPAELAGLELIECADRAIGVVHDRAAGMVTAVIRVAGYGFPLGSDREQDEMLAAWGAALSPIAREGSPVRTVVWHEWSHPITNDTHRSFLDAVGIAERVGDEALADYLELVGEQAPVAVAHEVLVAVTVDLRRIRSRRTSRSRLTAAIEVLGDEVARLTARLDSAGLAAVGPLSALDVSTAIRVRSDPGRADQVTTLARSLTAAARRGTMEWGPMVVEPAWGHVRVDGAFHRSYRIAEWPRLPVGADWLARLLVDSDCTRTVTVVLEPVPMRMAARAADREVMAREADSEQKERKGFRVNARERRRLADAERREHELSEGHAEFSFVGLVTVTAASLDDLDDDCAAIEQAAAQCLLDLRPLDARHQHGWITALPLGRTITPRRR